MVILKNNNTVVIITYTVHYKILSSGIYYIVYVQVASGLPGGEKYYFKVRGQDIKIIYLY